MKGCFNLYKGGDLGLWAVLRFPLLFVVKMEDVGRRAVILFFLLKLESLKQPTDYHRFFVLML